MPASGDQHKPNGSTGANPFEDSKQHISEYTAQEIATLQSRLNKRLGPEFISTRAGPNNSKVAYLAAEKAINLANEVFGFNGWNSSIQNIQIDFVEENATSGRVSIGLSVVVRVTLKDGTYHEDIGYGSVDNAKGKAAAFEKAKKEATTDGLKRALRNFGNVLGNCVYDKDFLSKVQKIKPGPTKFDPNDLHRAPEFAPKIPDTKNTMQPPPGHRSSNASSTDYEESFDVEDFDFDESELARPDEVVLPAEIPPQNYQRAKPDAKAITTPSKPPQSRAAAPQFPRQMSESNKFGAPAPLNQSGSTYGQAQNAHQTTNDSFSSPGIPSQHFGPPPPVQNHLPGQAPLPGQGPAVGQNIMPTAPGFFSAKAAQKINEGNPAVLAATAPKFDPHAESPSIRKTAGVDHSKSVPVRRDTLKAEPPAPPPIDPKLEPIRRAGMPQQTGIAPSPRALMSTSAYRPPTRHGSPAITTTAQTYAGNVGAGERVMPTAKRPPLNDVSNMQHSLSTVADGAGDAKRQRVSGGGIPPAPVPDTRSS